MNKFYALICACVLLLSSCGSGDTFTVFASVEGLGTQNVRAVYYSGDKVNVITSMALDGKFHLSGVSENPVLIDIYTGSRALIGHVIACNGETVELGLKLNEPGVMTVKGDKLSDMMAKFVTANADIINSRDAAAVNAALVSYIEKNPRSKVLPFLLLSFYDPSLSSCESDSVLSLVTDDDPLIVDMLAGYREMLVACSDTVRDFGVMRLFTLGDSVTTISATQSKGVLMAFSGDVDARVHEPLLSRLNDVYDTLKSRVQVIELSVVNDTSVWKSQVGEVRPRYTRCWIPGGVSSPELSNFEIKRLPWYVAADTTGVVVYSGCDFDEAVDKL